MRRVLMTAPPSFSTVRELSSIYNPQVLLLNHLLLPLVAALLLLHQTLKLFVLCFLDLLALDLLSLPHLQRFQ